VAGICMLPGQRDDVVALHHAMDLYVQSSDYEGTPNVVLEAMALETPVVASAVGGTGELIRDGSDGLLVPPGNRAALVAAIAAALDDPAARAARAAAARARVETDLSFDTRMARVESIYVDLMAQRSAGRSTPSRVTARA
jgi:glycosyltransferase involved in cell wall biosynthesis